VPLFLVTVACPGPTGPTAAVGRVCTPFTHSLGGRQATTAAALGVNADVAIVENGASVRIHCYQAGTGEVAYQQGQSILRSFPLTCHDQGAGRL
jgi:hypothetical protein